MFGNNGQTFQGNTTNRITSSPLSLNNHIISSSPPPPTSNANPFAPQKNPSEPSNVQFSTTPSFTSNPITGSQDFKPAQITAFTTNNNPPNNAFSANPMTTNSSIAQNPFATSTWRSSSSFDAFTAPAANSTAFTGDPASNPFVISSATALSSNAFHSAAQSGDSRRSFSIQPNQSGLITPSITTTFGLGNEKRTKKKHTEKESRLRDNSADKSARTRRPLRRKTEGPFSISEDEETAQKEVDQSCSPFQSDFSTPHKRPAFQQKTFSNSNKKDVPSASMDSNEKVAQQPFGNDFDDVSSSAAVTLNTQNDRKAELSSATNLDGLCIDKCSFTERELHLRVDELSVFEKSLSNDIKSPQELIVKRFQRSSADHKLDIAEEIRPPGVLRHTQLYLEQEIMDRETLGLDERFDPPRAPEPIELYNFCWDRTRMIRKDFTLQNYRGAGGRVNPIALDVHERIARYHIMCEHELCQISSFVAQQNMEQLGQTLKSLNELYDEAIKTGDVRHKSPFEPEFRAYFILCTLDNGRGLDVLKFVKGLQSTIMNTRHVQFAMKVFVARHTDDYNLFFQLLKQATFLQACLLFRFVASMRSCALQRMNRAYRNYAYPLADLAELLCFDDIDQAAEVCRQHGLIVSNHTGRGNIPSTEEDDMDEQELEETNDLAMIRFGGDFETDIELHRKKTPLEVRMSRNYILEKQRHHLRRDICRGVTEYSDNEYPFLSDLVQELEQEERRRLYPDRKQYSDEYSRFRDFRVSPPSTAQRSNANGTQGSTHSVSDNSIDLARIASRHAELNSQRKLAMERLEELQKGKELAEKRKREQEMSRLAEEMEAQQKKLEQEKLKLEQKKREEADRLAKQKEMEKKRQDQLQRELDEKAEKERNRVRMEELEQERERMHRMEEETKRRNEEIMRMKIAQAAKDRERKEKQLQFERQLAAKRKEDARRRKRQLAIMRFRFHMWKKYRLRAKMGPNLPQSLTLKAIPKAHLPACSVPSFIRASRKTRTLKDHKADKRHIQDAKSCTPIHLARHLSATLSSEHPNARGISWKLVVADLLETQDSSFASWCALMCGIPHASLMNQAELCDIRHTQTHSGQHVMTCARLIRAEALSASEMTEKLAGTSTVIFPVDLQSVSMSRMRLWKERVDAVLSALEPFTRVNLVVLMYTNGKEDAKLSEVQAICEDLPRRYRGTVRSAYCHFIYEGEEVGDLTYAQQLARILVKSVGKCEQKESMEALSMHSLLALILDEMMKHSDALGLKMHMYFQRLISELEDLWEDDVRGNVHIKPRAPELNPFIDVDDRYGSPFARKSLEEIKMHFHKLANTKLHIEMETLIGKSTAQLREFMECKCIEWIEKLFSMSGNALCVCNLTHSIRHKMETFKTFEEDVILTSESHATRVMEQLFPWGDIVGSVYSVYNETIQEECTLLISSNCKSRVEALLSSRKFGLYQFEWRHSHAIRTPATSSKKKRPLPTMQNATRKTHGTKKQKIRADMKLATTYRRYLSIQLERGA
uniref:Uncharacterized protein AlNc14C5G776 n=1 Tax=Albugo laibachii Nc14 TaxID=890382 RepID=F0W0Z6_9STRA|nr:conserved hypothetical protein [Albugo laibachii Nc14]|eukprot:CCA14720.1 conserved hypothetical protein [Albugo laibachii Nc14]